ncbi:DEAD/DEAH box helicase [Entomomonas asaccharolytica]|uniref:ATP-dependent RNA helicase DeaD n=1 Tax=Entomomonas asaccharolytica TaxID=2785331 RepID=A0A974RWI7_9GAMM|nr:DEAD/DEAH box helicase [Entomomonas asaccharolytica]QQP85266.1 DEAD/DEAH box helicase [Entomomonas asaccharolytica]
MTQKKNSSFAELGIHPSILAAIAAVGYEEPSPIQAKAIPEILAGHDIIGQAQTGTGKTAAFALPILSKIDPTSRHTQVLVLAPTRELALQVADAFESYAKQMPTVKVAAIYGGAPMGAQLKAIRNGVQVLVATPGRLCDHLRRDANFLSGVQFLVLDEADEMLKLGFMDDLESIFKTLPKKRQTALFSATLPASIKAIAEKQLNEPKNIKIAAKTQTVERIEQTYLMVHPDQKNAAVLRLLEVEDFDALIAFVRTKQATLDLATELEIKGYRVAALNGDIAQNQREKVIESLKDGRLDIVVATDVAARGLDVPRITHVFNVDMPYDPESYVHRIGRTGRAGRTGKALLLVTPRERRMLQTIERVTKQEVSEATLPNSQSILEARIRRLTKNLQPFTKPEESQQHYVELVNKLTTDLDCSVEDLAVALLRRATNRRPLTVEEIERTEPKLTPISNAKREPGSRDRKERGERRERGERKERGERGERRERGERKERGERSERGPRIEREGRSSGRSNDRVSEGKVRCRTPVGSLDGVAAKNLLGAILNEAGINKDQIGKITIRDSFSIVELPEKGLEKILTKLKDTRVAGKPLKLRRYRED